MWPSMASGGVSANSRTITFWPGGSGAWLMGA
jgi:hypothetical protein